MKILVINGPNLNLLGIREPDVYGQKSYGEMMGRVIDFAREKGAGIDIKQFNSEGDIIGAIQGSDGAFDGLVINPGAYTHYSYAIHDALKSVGVGAIEVHISNIHAREQFRRTSVTASACIGQISGLGFGGYIAAARWFIERKHKR